jgi:hypothetical protein
VTVGLALAWSAVEPAIMRGVPTQGLILIVAIIALPLLLLALTGAARLEHAAAGDPELSSSLDADTPPHPHGVVRHLSHHVSDGGDRHERPHAPRPHRSRPAHTPHPSHRAPEHAEEATEM